MWKTPNGVMLRKLKMIDSTIVKSYRVISLLSFLRKVSEKVASKMLAD